MRSPPRPSARPQAQAPSPQIDELHGLMADTSHRQLISLAITYFAIRRRKNKQRWNEAQKLLTALSKRAAKAEAAGLPFTPTEAERDLLFYPTKGL